MEDNNKLTMKAARINVGLTQSAAAKELGISKNTLSGYESGKVVPKVDIAKDMARLYKRSVDDIIFLPNDCALSTI